MKGRARAVDGAPDRRSWLASFADEEEALAYAWTRPGAVVVPQAVYLDDVRWTVLR